MIETGNGFRSPTGTDVEQTEITSLPRSSRDMLAWGLCLLPLVLFVVVAAYQRGKDLHEGEFAVTRTIQILEEHALRVFEAQQLIIDQTDQHLGDMAWSDIRNSEEVHRILQEVAANSPHVDGLWLVPPDGRTANSADFFPFPDVNVADRTYFRTLRETDELHYGEMIVGRTKGTYNFNLSRRRSPRENFNGVILVTSSLSYFTDFWEQASEGSFVAGLFREDGEILARYPRFDAMPSRLSPESGLLVQMSEKDDNVFQSVSSLDGDARVYGYSRIGETPLFIGYGVPNSVVLAKWRTEMLRLGLIALMGSILLMIATTTILRQNRRLSATALSWRRTAENLEQEVNRRVRAEDVAEERMRLLDEVRVLTAQRQSILENMAEGVIALDAKGCIIYANREAVKLLGPFRQGEQEFAALVTSRRILAGDGSELNPTRSPELAPLRGEDLPETEFLVRSEDGHQAYCVFRGGAIKGAEAQVEGAVLTFWDVSERKREAERQELLTRELDHRVRNMLATIMAMIRISNEPNQSKDAFVAALSGRLGAMARTHGVLSEGRWEGVTIGRLVDDEVASAAEPRQLTVDGDPDIMLPPKEAADLALGLHELATNATKHGAWSVADGCVTLKWRRETSAGHDVLRVRWKETGGPIIALAPEHKGFGSTLLHGIFAGADGVLLNYEPDGVRCTMTIPIDARQYDGKTPPPRSTDALPHGGASLEGLRVLVVEDEPVVRFDIMEIMRDAGAIIVAEAGTLGDGLEKAGAVMADVAILDRNLNGESSLSLAQLLGQKGAAIVFVSGCRAPDQPGDGGGRGDDHVYLQKPVSPEALVNAVAAAAMSRVSKK